MQIKIIDQTNQQDINLPNEPFTIWGKMIPQYVNEKWTYTIQENTKKAQMCFPNENYNYEKMKNQYTFIGAYDNEKCIGLAILQEGFFNYMYLDDLKVCEKYRGQKVASKLIIKAAEVAKSKGYGGIYTICQDNNVSACLFYLHSGFRIGGLDTRVYHGTAQEGKADIIFYLDN